MKGSNLINIESISFDSILSNYIFNISNLTDKYIIFDIYENCKGMNYISERRFICPKESINCLIHKKNNNLDKEGEKIIIIFYTIDKIINNNDEAFQALEFELFNKDFSQTAIINLLNTNYLKKFLYKNTLIIKENEIINDNNLFLNKIDDDKYNYNGLLYIYNLTNNYYIFKGYINENSNLFIMKPSISFVTPNNDKTILIKGSKNSLFEEGIVKFLLVVYPINEEIKSNDEAKEAFNLKKYDISYKKEIMFNVAIKDNENKDELDYKAIKNKITMKEAQEVQSGEVNKISFKNANDTNIKNNDNNNKKSELEERNKNKILEEKINELNNKIKEYK